MEAQRIASQIIGLEAKFYSVIGDPIPGPPAEMSLNGLSYRVTSAIMSKADELEYLSNAK